jgi:hypothetical protein
MTGLGEVDRVFGPPAVGGSGGGGQVTRVCRACQVFWNSEGVDGAHCWMCGAIGSHEYRYFHGSVSRFVDEPPLWYTQQEERSTG